MNEPAAASAADTPTATAAGSRLALNALLGREVKPWKEGLRPPDRTVFYRESIGAELQCCLPKLAEVWLTQSNHEARTALVAVQCSFGRICNGRQLPSTVMTLLTDMMGRGVPELRFGVRGVGFAMTLFLENMRSSADTSYCFAGDFEASRTRGEFWRKNDHDVAFRNGRTGDAIHTRSHWMCGTNYECKTLPPFDLDRLLNGPLQPDRWKLFSPERMAEGEGGPMVQAKMQQCKTLVLARCPFAKEPAGPFRLKFSGGHNVDIVGLVFGAAPETADAVPGRSFHCADLPLERVITTSTFWNFHDSDDTVGDNSHIFGPKEWKWDKRFELKVLPGFRW